MVHARIGGLVLLLLTLTTACAAPARPSFPAVATLTPTATDPVSAVPAAPPIADGIGQSYTIAKLGTFMPAGDIEDLDDGFAAELIFGRELLSFLAIEGSLGYLQADGTFGNTQFDLWAIPAFVNVRASVPILFFEPYGGIGLGGLYADYESDAGLASDDFVLAGAAFVGVEFGLGRLAVGAEYKYLQSEDTDDGFAIEGSTVSLFASLPF